jgi:hypothetical protein
VARPPNTLFFNRERETGNAKREVSMNSYESLLARVRQVRRRWRSQVWVKGISLFLVSAIALLVLGVWGADLFGFKASAVWVMRLLTGGTVLFVAWYFLYVPLHVRVTDVQVAQYIEENYPQLEDRLVTAVEYGGKSAASSGMIDLLIRDALDKSRHIDFSIFLKRGRLLSFGALGIAAFLALFALLNWGPSFFPYGFSHLYVPWTEASIGSSMMIKIAPGDVEIVKGADQQVRAQLVGFDSPDVRLYMQPEGAGAWDSSPMEPDQRGSGFRYLLIDVMKPLRYYAESKGVRSRIYSVKVLDLTRVERIDLTYNFPAYTGMPAQVVQNEGDISALKGTKVDFRIRLNRPAESARLLFDNQSTFELTRSGAQDFSGTLALQRSGSYVVQVTEPRGTRHPGSSEYEIEALEDAAPKVTITRPMRDVRATSLEEVFSEIKAEDDIGLGKLELRYSVNGGSEKVLNLYGGKPTQASVTGSHTFFLEEFGLQPGDVVSYYGKAWDNNNVTGPGVSSSDIYFIQIRPFEQNYKQDQQGMMSGGQGGDREEALSKQQKDIISATFKLIRDRDRMAAKEYLDSLKSLALVQSRLQAQAQNVVDRMQRRGAAEADEKFAKLSEYLKNAIGEMGKASAGLGAQKPDSAMPQEQKSLQQLMRAESLFREIQVSFAQNATGSGSQANAEDLADLFELELNKLKNQYETVQKGEQQAQDQKIDEAMQKLKELAQRQQQLNERNRMLAQQGMPSSSSAGGGGQNQQQLMEEAERLQRHLQRLSRERSSPQLNEAGNQIQKAIEEMKKALNSQKGNGAESTAQGMRALQQLDDAARKLAQAQESGLSKGLDQAVDESGKLVEEQKRIQEAIDRLAKQNAGSSEKADNQLREDLQSRKGALADRLRNLGSRIQDLSRQARKTQKQTSDKLAEAAGTIQDNRLPERILSGNALIQNGMYQNQKPREESIRGSLEELNRQLEGARSSIGQSRDGKLEEAANRARQLSEGLESMQQRMDQAQSQRGGADRSGRQSGRQNGQQPGQQSSQQQGQQGQQNGQQQGRGQSQAGQAQSGQGSEGTRGEQSARGTVDRNPPGGKPGPDVNVTGLSGDNSGAPAGIGAHRNEDQRQLNSELRQRLADAQELRPFLDRNSTQMQNLEKVIESLRRAGDYTNDIDPEQIARLKSAIDYMRKVEFDLARDLDRLNQKEKYFLSEDNEAPGKYQKLVEEYYKSLAKGK